jgi:hypothetical protein
LIACWSKIGVFLLKKSKPYGEQRHKSAKPANILEKNALMKIQ